VPHKPAIGSFSVRWLSSETPWNFSPIRIAECGDTQWTPHSHPGCRDSDNGKTSLKILVTHMAQNFCYRPKGREKADARSPAHPLSDQLFVQFNSTC
jgi:hypothetical protein